MNWKASMIFNKSKEKTLKMIWEVKKGGKRSFLIGTAHFFPYSFRTSLSRVIRGARNVLLEGPLDRKSMAKVVNAGTYKGKAPHLFDELDNKTVTQITEAIIPACRTRSSFLFFNFRTSRPENPVYDMVMGMRPWLAFFTLWSHFLEGKGWRYSVDLETHKVAEGLDKNIAFLESIEEQIEVLGNLSREKILHFLKSVDQWDASAEAYVRAYLEGDLEGIKNMGLRFPSRHFSVIDRRDKLFFERMQGYLEEGGAVVCVGAPHIRGLGELLRAGGYAFHRMSL